MNNIQYSISAEYKLGYDRNITPFLKSTYVKYICIYTTVDKFMKLKPPCKECLIQAMCIEEKLAHPTLDSEPDHLDIKACERLKIFIENSNRIKYKNRNQ